MTEPSPGIEEYAEVLAAGIEAALPGWIYRSVERIFVAWSGYLPPSAAEQARSAGERALAEVGPSLRRLLFSDIDVQRTTPLQLVRSAVRYPTALLKDYGVPPVERDEFDEQRFPDDIYGLSPASLGDVDVSLREPALQWGAAKAFEHKRRHRA